MIRRVGKNLTVSGDDAPAASRELEADGCTVLRGRVHRRPRSRELRAEIDAVFAADAARAVADRLGRVPLRDAQPQRGGAGRGRASADPRGDRAAARRRLPRDREHGVAQPAGVPGRPVALRRGPARARVPEGVEWDDRIPYPVFAIGAHLLLAGLRRRRRSHDGRARAATGRAGSRRSTASPIPTSPTTAVRRCCSPARPATCRSSCPTAGTPASPRARRSGPVLPAGALRPARHRAADPHHRRRAPAQRRRGRARRHATRRGSSSGSTRRTSTTAEPTPTASVSRRPCPPPCPPPWP